MISLGTAIWQKQLGDAHAISDGQPVNAENKPTLTAALNFKQLPQERKRMGRRRSSVELTLRHHKDRKR
jgi:hypothetical protein